jgi:biopolymer transport protein ExbB
MRSAALCPGDFLRKAQDAADSGDLEALAELAANDNRPLAKILAATCEVAGEDGIDAVALQKVMEEEGSRQMSRLWSRIQYLMDIGTIAPMVGLLGTVWGMMVSFTGLDSGLNIINKADRLADGVSQAMFTTFGGLIVGIVTIGAYALFRGHLNRVSGILESTCASLLRRIVRSTSAKNAR